MLVRAKAEGPGRSAVVIERMLRLHCRRQRMNLSDSVVEETSYDLRVMQQFVENDLICGLATGETTIYQVCWTKNRTKERHLGTPQTRKNQWSFNGENLGNKLTN